MKFARTDLIDRVEAEITRRQQHTADRNKKATAHFEKTRREYIDRTSDAWIELATTVRRRVRNSQPVTSTDIPKALRGGYTTGHIRTFDDTEPQEWTADTSALETLLDLLKSATDDEISTTHLERMGFRMAQLFRGR